MLAEHVGAVVIEADDWPIGIVTDRDIVCRVLAGGMDLKWVTAQTVMSSPPVTARARDSIDETVVKMRINGVRRLPIVSDDGMLVGIVALDDLLVLLSAELGEATRVPIDDRGP